MRFTREALVDLLRHMEWADAMVWRAALSRAFEAKLSERLRHLHLVQRGFLNVWVGADERPQAPESTDPAALRDWARPTYSRLIEHVQSVDESQFEEALSLPWASQFAVHLGPAAEPLTLGDTAVQVAFHTTHHRGQITTRLRELGGEPPNIDYIVWRWMGRPAAVWEAEFRNSEFRS